MKKVMLTVVRRGGLYMSRSVSNGTEILVLTMETDVE